MAHVSANGIRIEYEVSGPENGEPLLLIHGLGAQLIQWPDALCEAFAAQGFRVIRFDNRDVGLSTHFDDVPVPDIAAVIAAQRAGEIPELPYTVSDMADDVVGLLAALGIPSAHIFGVSLGSYIAQALAIKSPERIRTLTLVMSRTENPSLPPSDAETRKKLMAIPPHPSKDKAGFLRYAVALGRAVGSPGYPMDDAMLGESLLKAARRSYDPAGVGRQLAAARGAPDRRAGLQALDIPTLVVHGTDDPINPLACGEDIARNVKGSFLLTIKGMGHDLPPQLFQTFAQAAAMNAHRGR